MGGPWVLWHSHADVRARSLRSMCVPKNPRYIPTPPMFPNPVGLAHTPLETCDDMVVIYSVHFRPTHPKTMEGGLLWLYRNTGTHTSSMCVPTFFSVLGGINTWVQHLYSVPHDTGDKPQTGGNTSSGVFCVLFGTTTGRRGDSKSCWVVPGRLALTCRCACQIAQVDVRAKNPRYISTPPMFPNPVGLVRATGDVRRHGCDI